MKTENLIKRLEVLADDVEDFFQGDGTVNVEAFVAGVAALKAQLRPALPVVRTVVQRPAPKPKPKAKPRTKPGWSVPAAVPVDGDGVSRTMAAVERAGGLAGEI